MKRIINNPTAIRLMAASAFLALAGAANAAPLNGAFTWANLGTGNSDTLVGLSTGKTYLENINLAGGGLTINGVSFAASSGNTPSGTGLGGTTWAIAGPTANVGAGTNPGGTLGTLVNDFCYGGNTETLTLGNLTVGQNYIVTFYSKSWESAGNRVQTLSAANGPSGVAYDEDYLAAAQGELELLRYTFQAAAASQTINFNAVVTNTTMHLYGFGVEQTFNKSWSNGSNWTTATWSPTGPPNAQGANANFAAQGSAAAINLDANVTLGHLQLDGTNGWTVSGSNTLTLQADAAGVSVLSTPAGTQTISAPLIWSNDLLKTGPGTLVLSGAITDNGKKVTLGDGTLEISNSGTQTLASAIGGSGGLTKSGAGTLTLSGKSTYAGNTAVNGGTLKLQGTPTIGTASWATANSYTFSAAANNLLAGLSPTANTNGSGGLEGSAAVTVLTNQSDGGTYLTGGYTIGNNAVLTYTLPANASGYDISKINIYAGWANSGRENITISSIQYSTVANPTTFVTVPGSGVNYEGGTAAALASLTSSGGILGTGVYAIRFNFGTQENTYVGYRELEVVGVPTGSVNYAPANNLPVATAVASAAGSILDLAGGTQQVASLSDVSGAGGGVINSSAGTTSVLTLNPASGSSTFSGGIGTSGAGKVSLVMAGSGTQVLSGSGNTVATADFSGGTGTLTASTPLAVTGTLKLPGFVTGTLGGGTSFTAAGANLASTSGANTLALAGGTLAFALAPVTGNVISNGSFETGASGAYTYNPTGVTGWTFVGGAGTNSGAIFAAIAPAYGSYCAFLQNAGGQVNQTVTVTQGGAYQITFNSISRGAPNGPNPLKLFVDGTEVLSWTPNTSSWQAYTSNSINLTPGTHKVSFQGQGGAGDLSSCVDNVAMAGVIPAALVVNLPNTAIAATADSTLDLGAAAQDHTLGGLGLTANGAGIALTVGGANSLTVSGISAAAGTGTAAAIGGSTLKNTGDSASVASGVTLTVNSVLADGNGSGTRSNALTKTGAGTLVLTNTNGYTGATNVNNGTLLVNGASGSLNAASAVTVADGATFGGTGTAAGTVTWNSGAKASFTVTPSGGANTVPMAVTGQMTFDATEVHLNLSAGLAIGTYTLAASGTTPAGSPAATPVVDSGSFASGATGTVSVSGNNLILTVTGAGTYYTVSFDTNGGSTVADESVLSGGTATQPTPDPTKTGYTFAGWYADSGLTNPFVFSTAITGNTTVHAEWTANNYTVSFDAQSGTAPSPGSMSVTYGQPYGTLATTTRTGYTFAGWWTAAGGTGSQVTPATTVATAANHTLYAKWTINSYTVSFDTGGGSAVTSQTVNYNATATQPANPTWAAHAFLGWYADAGFTTPFVFSTPITGDTTIHAKWINTYVVSFNANGGTPAPNSQTVQSGQTATQPASPTKSGYTFAGWYTDDVTFANAFSFTTPIVADTPLYAKWDVSNWTYAAWTGDADSGVADIYQYTAAVNCNGSAVSVNNVPFQASATSGTNFSIGGAIAGWGPGGSPDITGNSLTLANTFIFNGTPRTVTLTNLSPGMQYETSFFAWGFDASGRTQTFATGSDSQSIDQDAYGQNKGIRISYTFTADSSGTKTFTITPTGVGTFHMSAFANRTKSAVYLANLTSFTWTDPSNSHVYTGVIDESATPNPTVTLHVPHTNSLNPLNPNPTFTLSTGATCDRTSGGTGTYNFTSPVIYQVVSSDHAITKNYEVTIKADIANTDEILPVPAALQPGDHYRLVFVTKGKRDATSTGIADYNTFVSDAANAIPALQALGTTWTCIGSTGAVNANTNTLTRGTDPSAPIYNLGGWLVAGGNTDLWDGTIAAPISIAETGATITNDAWTGTLSSGVKNTTWFLGDGSGNWVAYGSPSATGGNWVYGIAGHGYKTEALSLYAISGILAVPYPYTITASAGTHGSISPSGTVGATQGGSQSFTITPDSGYVVQDVVLDAGTGSESHLGAVTTHTFTNVSASHTITATFQTAYQAWLTANGVTDTPENFLKFGFGIAADNPSPGTAAYAAGPPPVVTPGNPTTTVTTTVDSVDFRAVFSRRHNYASEGLSYTLQFSADLNFTDGHRKDIMVTSDNGKDVMLLGTDGAADIMSVAYPWLIPTVNGYEKPTFFRVMVNSTSTGGQTPP